MDEEKMVEQEINVANEVVATIAGMAVSKVDGVAKMAGGFTEGLKAIGGKKQMSRGIKVETDGENVKIEINIIVRYEFSLFESKQKARKGESIHGFIGCRCTEWYRG